MPVVSGSRSLAVIAACLVAGAAGAAAPSLCQQLADKVRQSASKPAPLSPAPWIVTANSPAQAPPDPHRDVMDVFLRQTLESDGRLSAGGPDSIMTLEHLPGTQVYMGSAIAGTAHCQSSAFAQRGAGGTGEALAAPPGYTAPCWQLQGHLGAVLGRPAYIESGTVNMTSADTLTRITPWSAAGWGQACQLTVELTYRYRPTKQFCGDKAACTATGAVAVDVARRYHDLRQLPEPLMKSIGADERVPDFSYVDHGYISPETSAAVIHGWRLLQRQAQAQYPGISVGLEVLSSDFPTFGRHVPNEGWESSFSYVGFTLFPLMVEGHLYLGAVGHNGVGWREGPNILVAVYEPPAADQGELVPLAGFVIERTPAALKGTIVAEGDSALPARPGN